MAEATDWESMVKDAFGDEAVQVTPWIKLEEGVPFVGKIKHIAGKKINNWGDPYIEIWFYDDKVASGERHLDATLAIIRKIMEVNAQAEDTVKLLKTREMAVDKQGNPVYELDGAGNPKKDEAGNLVQQAYTRYSAEVVIRGGGKPAPAKKAEKPEPAEDGEIDIKDIPF